MYAQSVIPFLSLKDIGSDSRRKSHLSSKSNSRLMPFNNAAIKRLVDGPMTSSSWDVEMILKRFRHVPYSNLNRNRWRWRQRRNNEVVIFTSLHLRYENDVLLTYINICVWILIFLMINGYYFLLKMQNFQHISNWNLTTCAKQSNKQTDITASECMYFPRGSVQYVSHHQWMEFMFLPFLLLITYRCRKYLK